MNRPHDESESKEHPPSRLRSSRPEADADGDNVLGTTPPRSLDETTAHSEKDTDQNSPDSLDISLQSSPPANNLDDNLDGAPDAQTTVFAETPAGLEPTSAAALISTIGNFVIQRRLGRGGMGVVYLATDTALHRDVAVKVLRSGTDAEAHELQRFRREAQVIAQIRHPHIVQVFEVGEHEGLMYLVLEYMNGGSLAEFLDGTPLPADVAAGMVADLADAVAAAHQQGVVHRDLKPGNVLVALPEDIADESDRTTRRQWLANGAELKLADFGLAKSLDADAQQTQTGGLVGTPRYAAPEQLAAQTDSITAATDVYALGAILYELLTGSHVFRATDLAELFVAVREQEPVSPRVLNSTLSRDLETICLKCLQKAPDARYPTADQLRDDLKRLLNGEPILARPVGRTERALKWVRRHPLTTALWATSLIALLAVVGSMVSLAYQDRLKTANSSLVTAQRSLQNANRSLQTAQSQLKNRNTELESKNQQLNVAVATAEHATNLLARFRYAIDMQLASRAWNEGDVAQMNIILERNQAVDPSIKRWEWGYLNGLAHSELAHLHGTTAQYSPDGKHLAVGRPDGVVLLDANSLQLVREFEGPDQWATRVAFSGDGKRLMAGIPGGHVLVWDTESPTVVADFTEHEWGGETALNHDGSLALTTGWADDRTVKLWRTSDRQVLMSRYAEGGQYAKGIDFSPDGNWFAYGWPPTHSVCLARVATPTDVIEIQLGGSRDYYHSNDPAVQFDPVRPQLFASSGGRVYSIALPQGDDTDESANGDAAGASSGDENPVAVPTKIEGSVLAISHDGRLMLTAVVADHSVSVWGIDQQAKWNSIRGQSGDVSELSLQQPQARQDGATVSISASQGNFLFLRNCFLSPDFEQVFVGFAPSQVVYSPDGNRLAIAGQQGQVAVWENGTRMFAAAENASSPWDLAFSPDGSRLAMATQNGPCYVWNAADGTLVHTLKAAGVQSSYALAFNRQGTRLAVACDAGNVVVWDPIAGTEVQRHQHGTSMVTRVAFHPVTDELVSCAHPSIKFWGTEPAREMTGIYAPSLQFTADGEHFLARGGQVESDELLVETKTGKIVRRFQGHQATISQSRLFKDQSRLATVGDTNGRAWGTGTLRVWDFEIGQEVARLPSGGARSVAVSPDGRKIAAPSSDGAVRIYDALRFAASVQAWKQTNETQVSTPTLK